MNIVKNCADSCSEDLCLPEKMFSSFDFTPNDPVEFSAVLKPVVLNFVENSDLVQEMQANSIIISYYHSLCYPSYKNKPILTDV